MSRVFLFLKAYTLMGGFARGYTSMDLCKGWLRATSRNTFAFANCFRGGSCLAYQRWRKGRWGLSLCGNEKVFTGNWSTEALNGRRGLAGLCETGLGIRLESMHLVRRLNRRPLRRHLRGNLKTNTERQCQKQSVYSQHYLIALFFICAFAKCLRMCQI